MKIAVNAGYLSRNNLQLIISWASHRADDRFLFINCETASQRTYENIEWVTIGSNSRPLAAGAWTSFKIKRALKKWEADIYVSEGIGLIKSRCAQLLLSPAQPQRRPKKNASAGENGAANKKFFPSLSYANAIGVHSAYAKRELERAFPVTLQNIAVIYPQVMGDEKLLTFEEREAAKEKYADGNEYFIYFGPLGDQQNLLNMLKGFSFFKKRQRSKMKLLMTGYAAQGYNSLVESLRLYRFKDDIKLITNPDAKVPGEILNSAYAMLYLPTIADYPIEVAQAMQCGIPLIVSSIPVLQEYCEDAALYANPADINEIALQMMLIFKDEQKRKDVILQGKTAIKKFVDNDPEIALSNAIGQAVECYRRLK